MYSSAQRALGIADHPAIRYEVLGVIAHVMIRTILSTVHRDVSFNEPSPTSNGHERAELAGRMITEAIDLSAANSPHMGIRDLAWITTDAVHHNRQ